MNDLRNNQQKIEEDKRFIQSTQDGVNKILRQVEKTLADLEHIRDLPQKLEKLGINESAIRHMNELLDQSIMLSRRFEEFNHEMMAIRDFESYLGSFRQYRSGKQLRKFLYQELGFAGLVVYILHLLGPRRRNR